MADEILQRLGFDVSSAVSALENLDQKLAAFSGNVSESATNLSNFNTTGGATDSMLRSLASSANAAASAFERLNRAMGKTPAASIPIPAAPAQVANPYVTQTMAGIGITPQQAQAMSSSAAQVASATASAGQAVSNATSQAGINVKALTVSFETLSRVVMTQLIVRAMSQFRDMMKESFESALQYSKQISEIMTIAPPGNTQGGMAKYIADMSASFNQPLDKTAEAYYETLSNNFNEAGQAAQIMSASNHLAKVAVMDLNTAVLLLTGTLNAYGMSAESADTIGAKFFKTIELGRVRGTELANTFGRVAPVADELGVSIDEVSAAFSTITIGGVKASEAATQIRSAMSAIIKPSKDMKAAMAEIGYTSGEALISAHGFVGALEKLRGTTDGTMASLAKLFPNVRALNGVLRLSGEDSDTFRKHLEQIKNANSELIEQKFNIFIESNAEKVTKELNKLKVYLTTEFGQSLVDAAAKWFYWTGGADTAIASIKGLLPVLTTLTIGIGAAVAAISLMSVRSKILATDISQLGIVSKGALGFLQALAVYEIGKGVGEWAGQRIWDTAGKEGQAAEETLQRILEARKRKIEQEVETERQKTEKIIQLAQQELEGVRATYIQQREATRQSILTWEKDTEKTINKVLAMKQKQAEDEFRIAEKSYQNISKSQERVTNLQGKAQDSLFNYNLRRWTGNMDQQFRLLEERAQQLIRQGTQAMGNARTPEEYQNAQSLINRGQSFHDQAVQMAERSNNAALVKKAEEGTLDIINKEVKAEQQYQDTQKRTAQGAEAKARELQGYYDKMKEASEKMAKLMLTDDKKKLLSPEDQKKNLDEFQKQMDLFLNYAKKGGQSLSASDLLGVNKLAADFRRQMDGLEIKKLQAAPGAMKGFMADLQKQTENFVLNIPYKLALEKATGTQITSPEEYDKAMQELPKKQEELNQKRMAAMQLEAAYQKALDKTSEAWSRMQKKQETMTVYQGGGYMGAGGSNKQVTDQSAVTWNKLVNQVEALGQKANISRDDVIQLGAAMEKASGSMSTKEIRQMQDALQGLVEKWNATKDLTGNSFSRMFNQNPTGLTELEQVQKTLGAMQASNVGAPIQQALEAGAQAVSQVPNYLSGSQGAADAIRDALIAGARAMAQARLDAAAAASQNAGGVVGFASGGYARGQDTIAAMLSPGEMVVNATSTRRFYSQLQAMNAGMLPSFHNEGGAVSNTTNVGDIVINGASEPRETAREVMRAIRREQRRGTGRV